MTYGVELYKKRILFLSALDFKEKSIQVIRKTPEAYVAAGWDVRYIVARDTTRQGNYFYEDEINPNGVRIERCPWPLVGLRNAAKSRFVRYIWNRLAGLVVVFVLARRGARALRKEPADIIYGYEIHGVLAVRLLRLFKLIDKARIVSRFQGTWLNEILERRQFFRLAANVDQVIALRAKCDLAIMTDDGTRGDVALKRLGSPSVQNLKFWVNGTDIPMGVLSREVFRRTLGIDNATTMLLSVSRLERWKRVDRGIAIAAELRRHGINLIYLIVGGGSERRALERLVSEAKIQDHVRFVGPVLQADIFNYMNSADLFISMYDLTNVGNPLLEAIRMGRIVATLNNGDTGRWIRHMQNGLIYDVSDGFIERAGQDIAQLMSNQSAREKLTEGVRQLAHERLWTWQERMAEEVKHVDKLITR